MIIVVANDIDRIDSIKFVPKMIVKALHAFRQTTVIAAQLVNDKFLDELRTDSTPVLPWKNTVLDHP